MIQIKELSLTFPEKGKVFNDANFNIEKNKVTLIAGKSGCGKSSLLMSMAGVIPSIVEGKLVGDILIDGININGLATKEVAGEIGYIFQDADSQLCTFTVEDEIVFGLENINVERDKMDELIVYYLKLLKIEHLRYRNLNNLSGGEKQKVAIASVLAIEPKIILMDEPTANLDPQSTRDIIELIKNLRDEFGKTIILVEHKIDEIRDIVDDIVVFENDLIFSKEKNSYYKEYENKNIDYVKKNYAKNNEVLKVQNVEFNYTGQQSVLQGVSFNLFEGEILAIVGKNGVGKSTLSKLVMGLIKPTKGQIEVLNRDLKTMSVKKLGEHMGLVFQNPEHQFLKMKVDKELGLSLEIKGNSKEDVEFQVRKYLEMFDLEAYRDFNPFMLSQGQKRRLSTATMMINGQKILILDEPTYGQDLENLQRLTELLLEINEQGTSILIITHDMNLVKTCCDRVIRLSAGNIDYDGNPKYLKL